MPRFQTFEAVRGPDGKVRAGVWDRVCVPGSDEKDGDATEFTLETLSQMVDNFVERGDPIPIDYNHQSNYAAQNGRPAPALGWYGALAVVVDGQVVKLGTSPGVTATGAEPGLDGRDGLWCFRTEVTELGDQLLPNFKLLSPTFTPNGAKRDGTPIGYCLVAVAATNTPHQSGTEITFEGAAGAKTSGTESATTGARKMSMYEKLGLSADCTPEQMEAAFAKYEADAEAKMAKLAADEEATKMADDAEKAKFEADEDAKKMAADDEKAKFEADDKDDDKDKAKMSVMEATLATMRTELGKLKAAEAVRAKAVEVEETRRFEALADQAIAGGYPKEKRGALIKFARSDFEAARETVSHLLPKSAPPHLFDRLSSTGAPIGKSGEAREMVGPQKPKVVKSMGRNFIEDDGHFADEIKRVAESKDPVLMSKVDKYLPESERTVMFNRLLAAEKIVRAERPDLAEAGE